MNSKKAKLLLVCVCIIALMASFTACGSSTSTTTASSGSTAAPATAAPTASGEKVEIKFLHKWPSADNMPYFKQVVSDFEADNPNIKVKMDAVSDEGIKDKLRIIAGGGNLPDVTFTWTGDFLRKFIRADLLLDLTSYMNEDSAWKDSFYQSLLEPFSTQGKLYGIPLRMDGKFFVYNTEIFKKYNLQAPKTWDEFVNVCDTLKKNGVTPIELGNQLPWAAIHYITSLNERLVAQDTLKKDYDPTTGEFTDPGYVDALKTFKSMVDKGYFNKSVNSTSHDIASQVFYAGKAAMFYIETEEFNSVQKSALKDKWGCFPWPSMDGKGDQTFITGAPDGFVVFANTKHPKESVSFLKYITGQKEQANMLKMLGWTPAIKNVLTPETAPTKQIMDAMNYIDQAKGLAQWLDTELNAKVVDPYLKDVQLLLAGDKSAEDVMKEVQAVAADVKASFKQ